MLIKKVKAVGRWFKDVFYIKLLHRADGEVQDVAIGVDPGSKMEAYTVKAEKRTFI